MIPYYATWQHSAHARNATCNDCHVPHENAVQKWVFKGMDGMKPVGIAIGRFLTGDEFFVEHSECDSTASGFTSAGMAEKGQGER